MKLDAVKEELKARWGGEIGELCASILDFVASRPPDHLQMLTLRTLTHAAGKEKFDAKVLSAVTILSTSEFSFLDPHTLFIDDDDEQYEIPLTELAEARAAGSLVHPESGEIIRDFEEKIVPYFVPSNRLLEELGR